MTITPDHERIWLEPKCADTSEYGRLWCTEPLDRCDEHDLDSVEYVRSDLLSAAEARIAELQRELEPLRKGTHWPAPWKMTRVMHDAYNAALKAGVSAGRFWSELRDVCLAEQDKEDRR